MHLLQIQCTCFFLLVKLNNTRKILLLNFDDLGILEGCKIILGTAHCLWDVYVLLGFLLTETLKLTHIFGT